VSDSNDMSTRQVVAYRAAVVALALAFTGLLVVFWAAAKPASRIQVEEPIKVLTKRVNAGDGLRIQYTYCKQDEAIAIVGGFLASRGVIIPIQHLWASALPIGCHSLLIDIQVPLITPPGNYRIYLVREYQPTMFEQSTYSFRTEPFDVEPSDGTVHPAAPLPPIPPEGLGPDYPASQDPPSFWKRILSHLTHKSFDEQQKQQKK